MVEADGWVGWDLWELDRNQKMRLDGDFSADDLELIAKAMRLDKSSSDPCCASDKTSKPFEEN
jgi:hypothetical protein